MSEDQQRLSVRIWERLKRREFLKLSAATASVAAAHSVLKPSDLEASQSGRLASSGLKTGAQAVADALRAEGVEVLYGIPGVNDNELWDVIKEPAWRIRGQLVGHEFAASTMADGYARASGRVGVIALIPGPGLTNAASGIGAALLGSIPMVVVLTGIEASEDLHYRIHEIDHPAVARPLAKAVLRVTRVGEIQSTLHQAFAAARNGEPGPVIVEIPTNVYVESEVVSSQKPRIDVLPRIDDEVDRVVRMIRNAKQVGLYLGMGCFQPGLEADLVALAESLHAPVGTTASGKGAIPESHPLSVGYGWGPHATPWSEVALREVDLMIAIGVKFSEVATGSYSFSPPKSLIHVDINPAVFNKNYNADLCVHADARNFVNRLLERGSSIQKPRRDSYHRRIVESKAHYFESIRSVYNANAVNPKRLVYELRRLMDASDVLISDIGTHQFWAIETFEASRPRSFLIDVDYEGMGYSIPAAIGASHANEEARVVTVTGDGCFLMTGMEVLTAAKQGLNITYIVMDDSAYNLMQKFQKTAYNRSNSTVFQNPDFERLAESFGMGYESIENDYQLQLKLRAALHSRGPTLVRVNVDYSEDVRFVNAAILANAERMPAGIKFRYLMRMIGRALIPGQSD